MPKRCLVEIIDRKDKTSSWHLIGLSPDGSNIIGSTVSYRGETHRYTVYRDTKQNKDKDTTSLDHRLQIIQSLFMHLIRFPDGIYIIGSTVLLLYHIEEKPTIILYTYINRHAGTPRSISLSSVFLFSSFSMCMRPGSHTQLANNSPLHRLLSGGHWFLVFSGVC